MNTETKKELVGGFRIIYMVAVSSPALLSTIIVTYYISMVHHDQFKYPMLSITGTGLHYPQCIIFRFGMGVFCGYFAIFYHAIFKWIRRQAVKQDMYWPSIFSVIGYAGMVATIDSQGTRSTFYQGIIHVAGACIFLLFLGMLALNITLICLFIWKKNRKFMKTWSLVLKMTYIVYETSFIFIYLPLYALYQHFYIQENNKDRFITYENKAQWNLVIGSIIWMGLFLFDFKDLKITLKRQKQLLKNVDVEPNIPIQLQSENKIQESKNQIIQPQKQPTS